MFEKKQVEMPNIIFFVQQVLALNLHDNIQIIQANAAHGLTDQA